MKIPRNRIDHLFRPARVQLCGPQAYYLHDHDFGEIFWLDEGEASHFVNGVQLPLNVGELVFIRPPDCHSLHGPPNKPFPIHNLAFQWSIYHDLKDRYFPGDASIYGEDQGLPKTVFLTPEQLEAVRASFLNLMKSPMTLFHIERFLMNFFGDFCATGNVGSQPAPVPPPEIPSWMQAALKAIRQPEHLRLGVSQFCHLCGRCPEHVSREFRRLHGQTLGAHIHRLRLEHAAVLLSGTAREIVDIGLECGFESLSHFYVCFRKAYGTTPRRYRLNAQSRMSLGFANAV